MMITNLGAIKGWPEDHRLKMTDFSVFICPPPQQFVALVVSSFQDRLTIRFMYDRLRLDVDRVQEIMNVFEHHLARAHGARAG